MIQHGKGRPHSTFKYPKGAGEGVQPWDEGEWLEVESREVKIRKRSFFLGGW